MLHVGKLKSPSQDGVFAFLLAAAAVFALWKCPFGFGVYDDAFYLTVPHRLSMGDALFVDEWHVSQLAGLLTTPLVWLYRALTGSTDGILLAARYAYTALHALVSLLFYRRVRGYGWSAGAAALSWFLFTPYDLMALSYNTMAMDLILLSGTVLATSERRACWALSGLLLAGAVLCCPYFAAAYLLYTAGVGIHALAGRRSPGPAKSGILSPARLLWLTAGAGMAAALFLLYVLSTCGLRGVLDNLPYILADPEHQGVPALQKLLHGWRTLAGCHPLFPWVLAAFALLLWVMLVDRGRRRRRGGYLAAACALALACYALFWPRAAEEYYNVIMMPLIFPGLTAFLLCRDRPGGLFTTLFLGGLVYALAVNLGSNNYFHAISMALAVTNAASLLFMGRLLRELRGEGEGEEEGEEGPGPLFRPAMALAVLTVLVLLLSQVRVKAVHCLMEDSPPALTATLEQGPARGLRTTSYRAGVYERLNGELQIYKTLPRGKLLILNERSWCPLAADPMEYASFSGWISGENQTALERLEQYYRLNPGKVPDYIFLSKNCLFDEPAAILSAAQSRGYVLTESAYSWYLTRR